MLKAKKSIPFIAILSVLSLLSSCDKLKGVTKTKDELKSSTKTEVEIKTTTSVKENISTDKNYISEALTALYKKDYGLAVQYAEKAKNIDPNNPAILFVYAQALSMKGDVKGALKALDDAFKNGFNNKEVLANDLHLAGLRKTEAFKELIKKYGIKYESEINGKKIKKDSDEDVVRAGNVEIRLK